MGLSQGSDQGNNTRFEHVAIMMYFPRLGHTKEDIQKRIFILNA